MHPTRTFRDLGLTTVHAVLFFGAAIFFAFSAKAAGGPTVLGTGSPSDPPAVRVLAHDQNGVQLEFSLPTLLRDDLSVEGEDYQVLSIPGGDQSGPVGDPMVPNFTRLVMIPDRAGVQVSATVLEEEELDGFRLLPMQSEDGVAFVQNAETYGRDSFGTAASAQAGAPALMRGLRVVSLTFSPVQYNPAQGKVRVARRMRVEVSFAGENLVNVRERTPDSVAPSFDRLYRQLVVNYGLDGERAPVENGSYLVICPNDTQVTSRLQPLLDWRQREGYVVRLATTAETGSTSSAIKAYITNAYNTWNPPPEFVVLAGDADGSYAIPTWSYNGGEADHAYTQLDGTDLISDVHLGRLSFSNTTELEVIVAKTVGYESTPNTADPTWFARACLVGDPNSSGYSTVQVMQWVKTRLRQIGYTQIDTIFGGNFVSQMSAALNLGDTIFAYRGYYGFSGWSNGNTNALTNIKKLHFACISTCGTGSFSGGTSNSEAFLRAGSVTAPKAGIGAIGTATLSTHTRYNNCLTMGVFQGLLYEDLWEMGAAFTRGKYELFLNYGEADGNQAANFCNWNNLMGDPACRIWTAAPTPLNVTYPSTVALGANSVIVGVHEQGGAACADAQVCLWKGTETFVVGQTDAQGDCELLVNLPTAGAMKLTVTKHNRVPLLADITVGAQNLYVGYQASGIDDDNSGGSQGNSDGQINPGETIQLRVQLKNFGSQIANSVSATLTSDDPYVTISDANDTFGNIAGGASAWSVGTYLFSVSPGCPHGHAFDFGLNVTSGSNNWHSLVPLSAVSADLVASVVTLYGGGQIEPGQTREISIRVRNQGGQSATNVSGLLTSQSPWVSVTDGTGTFGTIPAGGLGENTTDRFTISADPGTYQGHLAVFRLVTTFNGGALDTTYAALTVGTRSSDDPTGPDHYGYYAFDNTDTSYPEAPTYNWVEIDPNQGGSGVQVTLGDNGDYQDKSRGVDLPFTFRFYGQNFQRATICSNGWLSMGDTYLADYRNWTIPGAGAPQNLIAVFWDDLYESGSGHVYQKYDATNHRWIVEWSHMINGYNGSSQETCEVILFDPAFYPTATGDGMILAQYNTVNNVDGVDGYATAGIQNWNHTDGLLYSYFNLYPGGSATLAAGRAIMYRPVTIVPQGTLQGIVRNQSHNNDPISGASVSVLGTSRVFTSGADGRYTGGVPEGTYTVVCARTGFKADTVSGVQIVPSQVRVLDFLLTDIGGPTITGVTQLQSTTDPVGPYDLEATVEDPSGVSSVTLVYRANNSAWTETPMTGGPGVYHGSIPGMAAGIQIDYYVRAEDGIGYLSIDPPGAPSTYYTFLITSLFYTTDCEDPGDPAWQLGVAGDNATTGIWIGDDPVGTIYNGEQVQPEDDHTPDPGVKCFVTGNGTVGGAPGDNDVDGGCTTLQSPVFSLGSATQAYVRYWRWVGLNGLSVDDEIAVDVSSDGGGNWVALERISQNEAFWKETAVDLSSLITLTDQVVFRFVACDLNAGGLVEVAIDDFSLEVFIPDLSDVPVSLAGPAVFQLAPARPNPSSGSAAIQFSLEKGGRATLAVFDVQGRCVRRLLDGARSSGPHVLVWDGRDDLGNKTGSGLYFYKLEANGQSKVQRLLRVE